MNLGPTVFNIQKIQKSQRYKPWNNSNYLVCTAAAAGVVKCSCSPTFPSSPTAINKTIADKNVGMLMFFGSDSDTKILKQIPLCFPSWSAFHFSNNFRPVSVLQLPWAGCSFFPREIPVLTASNTYTNGLDSSADRACTLVLFPGGFPNSL